MMNYAQQIKHPMWQKKRLEVLEANNYECENCGSKDTTLHVHHPFYKRGAMIWEYEKTELECLCEKCHKEAHAIDEKIKKMLSGGGTSTKHKVLGYLSALNTHEENPNMFLDSWETVEGAFDAFVAHAAIEKKSVFVDAFIKRLALKTGEPVDFREFRDAIILTKWQL
jgi:hypothetical protein